MTVGDILISSVKVLASPTSAEADRRNCMGPLADVEGVSQSGLSYTVVK